MDQLVEADPNAYVEPRDSDLDLHQASQVNRKQRIIALTPPTDEGEDTGERHRPPFVD